MKAADERRNHPDELAIEAYIDDELAEQERTAVADHLQDCSRCRHYAQSVELFRRAVRSDATTARVGADDEQWDVEVMVQQVQMGINAEVRHGRRRILRWLVPAAAAAVAAAVVIGSMSIVFRRNMIAQERNLVETHYVVRSGAAPAVLVSYPGR